MNIHTTLDDRGKNYGSFEERCRVEQTIKRAFASGHQWESMPDDCRSALEMIATKISRIVAGNNPEHHDSWLDISGYATLVADRIGPPGAESPKPRAASADSGAVGNAETPETPHGMH